MKKKKQRHQRILTLLDKEKKVTVDALVDVFKVSQVTVRKDLQELEQEGSLIRRFGGAVAIGLNLEDQIDATAVENKVSIAKLAGRLVKDNQRLIIDYGTTTAQLVSVLAEKNALVVMSNSLVLANLLTSLPDDHTVLMTGGTWDKHSHSFQGALAESMLRSYDFDWLFVGADGLNLDCGTTTFKTATNLSSVMADCAKEVVVMIESRKINQKIPNIELTWEQVSYVVTDKHIRAQDKAKLEAQGIKVLCE